jgi:formate dehydrogenase iron-sulfur subunit
MRAFAILTDVTLCIGCEECVLACKRVNHTGEDAPWAWQRDPSDLSSTRWTTIVRAPRGRYVRVHCRHCLEPACASACPVGALHRTPEGAVTYDSTICMGCRYCMVACPFKMTRYEWSSPTPRVRKCVLCYEKIRRGELKQPACTAACPAQATIFGDREVLLAEARARLRAHPGRYIDHVWGEHEVGGTSVLYISDVDLSSAGWPAGLKNSSYPALTLPALHLVPGTFVGVTVAMAGLSWVIRRRQKLAEEGDEAPTEREAADDSESKENKP